jgi:hypothetical protein
LRASVAPGSLAARLLITSQHAATATESYASVTAGLRAQQRWMNVFRTLTQHQRAPKAGPSGLWVCLKYGITTGPLSKDWPPTPSRCWHPTYSEALQFRRHHVAPEHKAVVCDISATPSRMTRTHQVYAAMRGAEDRCT